MVLMFPVLSVSYCTAPSFLGLTGLAGANPTNQDEADYGLDRPPVPHRATYRDNKHPHN